MNWIPVNERLPTKEDYEPFGTILVHYADEGEHRVGELISFDLSDAHSVLRDPKSGSTHWCRIVPPGASSPCERCEKMLLFRRLQQIVEEGDPLNSMLAERILDAMLKEPSHD